MCNVQLYRPKRFKFHTQENLFINSLFLFNSYMFLCVCVCVCVCFSIFLYINSALWGPSPRQEVGSFFLSIIKLHIPQYYFQIWLSLRSLPLTKQFCLLPLSLRGKDISLIVWENSSRHKRQNHWEKTRVTFKRPVEV